MADSPSSPSSSRVKKRQRQKTNLQKRAAAHDALITLHENPTFGNAFRAWLAHVEETLSPQELRSAAKFTRALRSFSSRGSGEPDYPETSRISADTLAQWVDDLAWSLNLKFTMKENTGELRSPTSRIGTNFRSFIHFLAQACLFAQPDLTYLLDECRSLGEDLDRTARINRIMEEYTWYIQEAYFDAGRTVDETFRGEYEVDRISGQRILVLRRYDPDESDTASTSLRAFTTFFPAPLVNLVKRGDTLNLQICHLEQNRVWVPYMYSGITPTRDDGGNATPTDRQLRPSSGQHADDPLSSIQASLMRLDLSARTPFRDSGSRHSGGTRSRTPQRRSSEGSRQQHQPQIPGFDFNFNEAKYTDAYFRAWEGDIDTDEDFTDIVSPPGEGERGVWGGSSTGVNLFQTLRERHS